MKTSWSEPLDPKIPNNLPIQPNSFIGRERELARLRPLVWSTRLLTLTGPGGCGKTRLALKLAQQLLDAFSEGVWFVDLAPLPANGPVPQAVASVFAIQEPAGRSYSAALVDYLRPREMLLLLDNCEHVLPACAELATHLLRSCPNLFLLVTSREALNIDGETAWQTPPLSTLGPDAASASEAARLFVDRARAVQPAVTAREDDPTIAQICAQLDGLPLAIELAAARVATLSVEQIATRLVDRFNLLNLGRRTAPARHQTLRAMIDWSYGLLSPEEKQLFRRLAVFSGGWTIEAAEAVCSDADGRIQEAGEPVPTWEILSRLVTKSLVIAGSLQAADRYHFLETMRQYAREKFAPGEPDSSGLNERIRDRHLVYFAGWVERSEPGLISADQHIWLERFEREHENIRTALDWGLSNPRCAEQGLKLAVTSARFFRLRGYLSEGRAYLEAALALEPLDKNSPLRARGLTWLANLAYLQSDYPVMHSLLDESLSIWRSSGLERSEGYAEALEMLGELMTEEGDYSSANQYFEDALQIYRALNYEAGICEVLMQFGWAAMRVGDYPDAQARLEEFLGLARKRGYATHIGFGLSGLGELAVRQGQYASAKDMLEESLELRRARGDLWGAATSLGSLGWAALRQGDYSRMRAALQESIVIRQEIGDQSGIAWCLEKLSEGILGEAQAGPAGSRREMYRRSAQLFGAAAAIRAPLGSVIDPADQAEYERNVEALRSQLGEAEFADGWKQGEQWVRQDPGLETVLPRVGLDTGQPGAEPERAHEPGKQPKPGGLSRREREVAQLIVQGMSNRKIAETLTVETKTVEAHITHIFNKLGFDSRVQIAVWAVDKGLARPPED